MSDLHNLMWITPTRVMEVMVSTSTRLSRGENETSIERAIKIFADGSKRKKGVVSRTREACNFNILIHGPFDRHANTLQNEFAEISFIAKDSTADK
ncbi:hypothetical protein NQ318_023451 [Aromia moschata]|uniref:Uncharacterized protein n=1 Tax=Aromia moschata TaxID=1265417 RepID=A0AAV8YK57_9CUCU|nr:hypothetical protein NQ318_023451 [Aromia moschata]